MVKNGFSIRKRHRRDNSNQRRIASAQPLHFHYHTIPTARAKLDTLRCYVPVVVDRSGEVASVSVVYLVEVPAEQEHDRRADGTVLLLDGFQQRHPGREPDRGVRHR